MRYCLNYQLFPVACVYSCHEVIWPCTSLQELWMLSEVSVLKLLKQVLISPHGVRWRDLRWTPSSRILHFINTVHDYCISLWVGLFIMIFVADDSLFASIHTAVVILVTIVLPKVTSSQILLHGVEFVYCACEQRHWIACGESSNTASHTVWPTQRLNLVNRALYTF